MAIILHYEDTCDSLYKNLLFWILNFAALRRVIQEYSGVVLSLPPPDNGKKGYGLVTVRKIASFFEVLDGMINPRTAVESEQPMAMESVGQVPSIFTILISDGFF